MPYTKTTWIDRAVQYAQRYALNLISGSTYDITAEPGTITNAGTAINAAKLNNLENAMETVYDRWDILSSGTTGADAAQIDISIDTSYKTIEIILNELVCSTTGVVFKCTFNSDTGASNYGFTYVTGAGTATGSSSTDNIRFSGTNGFLDGSLTIRINNMYSGDIKTVEYFGSSEGGNCLVGSGMWKNTADLIDTINLSYSSGNIMAGLKYVVRGYK